MKKMQWVSICVLLVTVLVMVVNKFIFHLPDWLIRTDGIVMLIGVITVSYSTVKLHKGKQ